MSAILHGDASGNQLNASANKTQVYGLKGNDTLTSDGKSDVLLIGGAGDDSLIMNGGNGTLSGGAGSDTFELNYSAAKKISAVIEDLEPSSDRIIVNFDGSTAPQLTSSVSGSDVVWRDSSGNFSLTIKGIRENDYFDGDAREQAWQVLKFTNDEREENNLSWLTMADGLTAGASIRVQEITELGTLGLLTNHTRPNGKGDWRTVFDEIGKSYVTVGENLDGGATNAEEVVEQWMGSQDHKDNILKAEYKKLGVGYNEDDPDPTNHRFYWVQWFAAGLSSTEKETVSTENLLTANMTTATVSRGVTLTQGNDIYTNTDYGATIAALGGNDSISNSNVLASISGGNDDDTIYNYSSFVMLDAGSGDDLVLTKGEYVTINGGLGDDLIGLSGNTVEAQHNLIEYKSGDGNDTIGAFNSTSTLRISGDEYTPVTVGNNVVVSVGNDLIELRNAAYLPSLNIEGTRSKLYILTDGNASIENSVDGAHIQNLSNIIGLIVNRGTEVTMLGGDGSDTLLNWSANNTMYGNGGNDYIGNNFADTAYRVLINGGAGSDTVNNDGANSTIFGGSGNDSIVNRYNGSNVTIDAGLGDDFVGNGGSNVTIEGGFGNDILGNSKGSFVTMLGGYGNDTIRNNEGENIVMNGESGNDVLWNYDANVTINGNEGNDIIINAGSNATINAGTDNDNILLTDSSRNNLIQYKSGDGRDSVNGFKENDTLIIGDGTGTYHALMNDKDILVMAGTGSILLQNAASLSAFNIAGTYVQSTITAYRQYNVMQLTESPVNYSNSVEGTAIITSDGDNTISNTGNNSVFLLGKGNDSISNEGNNVIIYGDEGEDTIANYGSNASINGDEGADALINTGNNVIMRGGAGEDSLFSFGDNVTIRGNEGDDQVSLASYALNNSIRYNEGDGNDSISGFNEDDTLRLITATATYSTQTSGNDIVVKVGTGSVTLLDMLDAEESLLPDINIVVARSDEANENEKFIILTEGNDTYRNYDDGVTIAALGGNDSIYNLFASDVSISGAEGDDTINNDGSANVTIDGGSGNDDIVNNSSNVTIDAGEGNDTVNVTTEWMNISINGGTGNDSIEIKNNNVTVMGGDGDDTIHNYRGGTNSTILGGDGNDDILNWGASVSIDSGNDNDNITNREDGNNVTIISGGGDDKIFNRGSNVTIMSGTGNDSIYNMNDSNSVTIDSGEGNDTINNDASNVTITGSTGDDLISLSSNAKDNVINYASGDGNDTIWGFSSNLTLDLGGAKYTSLVSNDDVILQVGTGSITLKDARERPLPIIIGESGSSGGTGGNDGGGGSGGNDGGGRGGNDGGRGTGGTSGNEGRGSDASGGNSASGSRGNTGNTSGGTYGSNRRNPFLVRNERQNTSTPTPSTTPTTPAAPTTSQIVYTGGNQVISNYAGEPIIFGGEYTGAYVDGGTFYFGSTTGALAIQNAADKFIDIRDASGNAFIKGYLASTAGTIDGRNLSGFEVFNGSSGADEIFAGNGGSQMWGGAGNVSDKLTGGNGVDIFIGGKDQGADNFFNASSNDIVHFTDASLSDIAYTTEDDGTIVVAFNNGNVVNVQSSESTSARFLLADGAEYRYDHANKSWQTNQRVYGGGNQVVSNYAGEKIIFGDEFAGAYVDGNNFNFLSTTGALTIQNAADKLIDLRDGNGNAFIKGYAASTAGTIDGRNLSGFEVFNGSSGTDEIFAGNGGSQLWGGVGNVSDVLTGGNGSDIFIGGQNQGADAFLNASSNDIVHLNDASLSDIVSTAEDNGTIAITFANGNDIAVRSTETLSARFLLADGSTHQFNHANKSWQRA